MAVLAVAIVIGLLNWRSTPSGDVKVRLFFKTTQPEMVELYWSTLDKYSKDWSSATAYPNIDAEVGEVAEVSAQIRTDKTFLRVDLGSQQMVWTITGVVFESGDTREELSDEVLLHPLRTQDVESISRTNAGIEVAAKAGDPPRFIRQMKLPIFVCGFSHWERFLLCADSLSFSAGSSLRCRWKLLRTGGWC